MFDQREIKKDFPILERQINGHALRYLDNAATSQKPRSVIEAITHYYETSNANVHRGVHTLSDESTKLWQESRQTIARFFGADPAELIITRNTTEAVNGVVYGWAEDHIGEGDIVVTTLMEHHADIVPWQELVHRKKAELKFIGLDVQGRLRLDELEQMIAVQSLNLKLIVVAHASNALGTLNPVERIAAWIKESYAGKTGRPRLLVDGAQTAPHLPINFHELDADFFAFSGHKMLGPMGIGGLLVRKELLTTNEMKPWLFGGGMIAEVSQTNTIFNEDTAERFTAGTPDVASLVGLAAACSYLQKLGMHNVLAHDQELVRYALEKLQAVPEVELIGPTEFENGSFDRIGSVSFIYRGVHAHDVAQVLDSEGIAVRSGHHCTMPLHTAFNWQASVRVSFQVYNSTEDIDALVAALSKVKQIFSL